jgi:DUF438 domain-containing protein
MNEGGYADLVLDNIRKSIVYVDRDHVIRYLNAAGREHYARFGDILGRSLWDCHNEASKAAILDYVARLEAGEDEVLYLKTPEKRVYIRAARAGDGELIGYYEIAEPPRGA